MIVRHGTSMAVWYAEFQFVPDVPRYANNTPTLGRDLFMCTGDASSFSLFVSRGCCLALSISDARSCTNATTYIISLLCRWICIYAHENMLTSFFVLHPQISNRTWFQFSYERWALRISPDFQHLAFKCKQHWVIVNFETLRNSWCVFAVKIDLVWVVLELALTLTRSGQLECWRFPAQFAWKERFAVWKNWLEKRVLCTCSTCRDCPLQFLRPFLNLRMISASNIGPRAKGL